MEKTELGQSGLEVSVLCLGTMTFGTQTGEAEAHAQLDRAVGRGVNFLDMAEMYPVNPLSAETAGRTEEIVGNWLKSRGGRERMVLASKITGAGSAAIPGGPEISAGRLRQAIDASLKRLQTDVIDLYQLHWPNRGSYHFRKIWGYDPSGQDRAATVAHMCEVLETLQSLKAEGKLRHFGLSNETAWGSAMWLRLADENGLPRPVSIQNEYSLLCRHFDSDLAELSVNEALPLLAYSPLAAGLLTGKYAGGVIPEGSRRSIVPELGGRVTPRVFEVVAAYMGIARNHGLDPVQMAIAFCRQRPFACVPIIGATRLEQLDPLLDAAALVLPLEVLEEIEAAHKAAPMPF